MNDLTFDIYIAAAPQAVWQALTGREGVAALYFGSRLVTSFEPGTPYRYVGVDAEGAEFVHVEGEILACAPGEELTLTHRAGARWQKGLRAFTSRLSYQLTDLKFATRLRLVHDRWEEGDPGHAHNAAGWMIFLSSVKSYVETGKPLPLPV